jgi:hypothetical protein
MASVSLGWNDGRGFDIHVLEGETSASLLDLLIITADNGTSDFAHSPPADVDPSSIRFEPNFASLMTPPSNAGITVNTSTGEVEVKHRPAPPRLERFVIEATVRTKPPSSRTLGPIPIRVQVHDSIDELWLTPSPLTVRRGTTGTRFSVLARFDDNTIGDITHRAGIKWSHLDPVQPGDPRIRVGEDSGELVASEDAATVTITARHAGLTATASAEASPRWSEPLEAVLLRSRSAGIARMAAVPNVLFLSEGFGLLQRTEFEELVRKVVDQLQDSASHLRPFDLLKGGVNYWMAFVPSRQPGTSPLYDMNVVPVAGGGVDGREVPLPERPPSPPAAGASLTLPQLIYAVGLPSPADAPPVTLAGKRAQWLFQYGPSVALHVPGPPSTLFGDWQGLHAHQLANEADSAFGVALGDRPKMFGPAAHRVPGFSQRRATSASLDDLLANVFCQTATGAPKFGSIWVDPHGTTPAPSGPGLPTGLQRGQDRGLVFFLLGGARMGGSRPDYAIFGSLINNLEVKLKPVVGSRRVDLDPHPLPPNPSLNAVATVAHEVSHALGLLDEYGEFEQLIIPDAEVNKLESKGNVQPAKDLAISTADPRLDPAKLKDIKWLWPRLSAAGVLRDLPVAAATAGELVVRLRKGHAADFRKNDIVKLRKQGLIPSPAESVRLTVTLRPDLARDEVTVKPLDPSTSVTLADWPAGSLLIRPVRGAKTPADPNGPDLPLVAQVILDHLALAQIPLNPRPAAAGHPAPLCIKDEAATHLPSKVVQIPGKPPAALKRPTHAQHIVGLYDGGARYFCGVYHPSGECLMRQLTFFDTRARERVYPLCWVCAYWLVDRLDPTKHRVIERAFAGRYPRL